MVAVPIIVGAIALILGLLILRFVIKTTVTLVKVALVVGIAVAVWLGLQLLL